MKNKIVILLILSLSLTACGDSRSFRFFSLFVPINQPPTASAQSVTVTEAVASPITLMADDSDGIVTGYQITTPPTNGTLSGTGAEQVYTSDVDFNGIDTFQFTVTDNDGAVSSPAAMDITVNFAPPQVSLSPRQFVNSAAPVTLRAAVATKGTITSTAWRQLTGTEVTIADPTLPEIIINAPSLTVSERLSFEFVATDNLGQATMRVAFVTVNPMATDMEDLQVNVELPASMNMDGVNTVITTSQMTLNIDMSGNPTMRIPAEESESDIVSLSDQFGNPTLIAYKPQGSSQLSLSVESSAVVFVLRSRPFYGANIINPDELTNRIKSVRKV